MQANSNTPAFYSGNIPTDILSIIFEYLADQRDLHTCAQICRLFNLVATPLLYRTVDTRIITKPGNYEQSVVLNPGLTLLQRPEYAKYVRYVRLTGAIATLPPRLLKASRETLRLCVHTVGFSWTDDSAERAQGDAVLLDCLSDLRNIPIKQLTIRTYLGLSEEVWSKLIEYRGLCRISIWTMEGPPRILKGWSEKLGSSLTHLELGRCAGVPASILVSVISHLPLLKGLRLKGAPTSAILEILTFLPALTFLDTEYFGSGVSRYVDVPVASLRQLTVRTSSVDVQGPQQLWPWIQQLIPRPSLESFTLNAFSTQGDANMPRRFLLDLAYTHKETLKHFQIDSVLLTLEDLECLCTLFPALESLSCSIALCQNANQIADATLNAHNLREMRLYSSWRSRYKIPFEVEDARKLMMRDKSRLRVIGIERVMYTGRWVLTNTPEGLEFEVTCDVVHDS